MLLLACCNCSFSGKSSWQMKMIFLKLMMMMMMMMMIIIIIMLQKKEDCNNKSSWFFLLIFFFLFLTGTKKANYFKESNLFKKVLPTCWSDWTKTFISADFCKLYCFHGFIFKSVSKIGFICDDWWIYWVWLHPTSIQACPCCTHLPLWYWAQDLESMLELPKDQAKRQCEFLI